MDKHTVFKGKFGYRARSGLIRQNVGAIADVLRRNIAQQRSELPAKRGPGRPRKGYELAGLERDPTEAALIITDWIAVAAMSKKPMKRLAAAILLGSRLLGWDRTYRRSKEDDQLAASLGFQAAAAPVELDVIEEVKPTTRETDRDPVRLTEAATAQYQHLLDAWAPPPVLETAPAGASFVKRSKRSSTYNPAPGARVQEALDIIRATRWRINPHMVKALTAEYAMRKPLPPKRVLRAARAAYKWRNVDVCWLDQRQRPINFEKSGRARNEGTKAKRVIVRAQKMLAEQTVLHTAQSLLDKESFYLDGHWDFRGRYYQDGYRGLQWTSAPDATRSLLEFADGYILHKSDLLYLELQLTSMWGNGVDKHTDEERHQWVEENLTRIVECVDDFGRRAFWRKAKSKFRFLAACEAYRGALVGEPVHLPCSFDVIASGVGVRALLLRDELTARRVSLVGNELPTFFKEVAKVATQATGKEFTERQAKQAARGGMYGAGLSRESLVPLKAAFWNVFPEGRRLLDWLRQIQETAGVLTWTLPDGFVAVNDYREMHKTSLNCHVGKERIEAVYSVKLASLDQEKLKAAIDANFIHSWDGAFLRAVVRRLAESVPGVSVALAHDCFTTHANHVRQLTTFRGDELEVIEHWGALHQAAYEVFGPDRLAELGWPNPPGIRGVLTWELGPMVG